MRGPPAGSTARLVVYISRTGSRQTSVRDDAVRDSQTAPRGQVEYFARNSARPIASADQLSKKLQSVAQHMESNNIMSKKDLLAVRKAASDPNSLFSTSTLNAYVHNANFYPSSSELKTSWDNLEPFVEKLWHG